MLDNLVYTALRSCYFYFQQLNLQPHAEDENQARTELKFVETSSKSTTSRFIDADNEDIKQLSPNLSFKNIKLPDSSNPNLKGFLGDLFTFISNKNRDAPIDIFNFCILGESALSIDGYYGPYLYLEGIDPWEISSEEFIELFNGIQDYLKGCVQEIFDFDIDVGESPDLGIGEIKKIEYLIVSFNKNSEEIRQILSTAGFEDRGAHQIWNDQKHIYSTNIHSWIGDQAENLSFKLSGKIIPA